MAHTYDDLTRALPQFVNLAGLVEIARDVEDPDLADECERDSVRALVEAIGPGDIASADSDNRTLIADSHWLETAQDDAESMGFLPDGPKNPLFIHIDWEAYADQLKVDYHQVEVATGEFAGTWWVRS